MLNCLSLRPIYYGRNSKPGSKFANSMSDWLGYLLAPLNCLRLSLMSYGNRPNNFSTAAEYFRTHFLAAHKKKDAFQRRLYVVSFSPIQQLLVRFAHPSLARQHFTTMLVRVCLNGSGIASELCTVIRTFKLRRSSLRAVGASIQPAPGAPADQFFSPSRGSDNAETYSADRVNVTRTQLTQSG